MRHALHILLLAIIAAIVFPHGTCAQERAQPSRAEEVWTSFAFSGRPPKFFNDIIGKGTRKRFGLGGEIGYRTADVFFAGRQIYFDGEIGYDLTDIIEIGVEHRYAYRPDNSDRQRSQLKFQIGDRIARFDLSWRSIFQHSWHEYGLERDNSRNRFSIEYDIPKWKLDPEFRVEFFTTWLPEGLDYIGTRYQLGTEWSPWSGHGLSVAVIHDRERNVARPDHRWIISFEYSINIRKIRSAWEKAREPSE